MAAPVGTSLSLTHASGSRAPTPNQPITDNSRHSCPFQQTPQSPSSKLQPFWSLTKDGEAVSAKRLSLNAVQQFHSKGSMNFATSSKGSGSTHGFAQNNLLQPQSQNHAKSVRKATINLSKNSNHVTNAVSTSRNQLITAQTATVKPVSQANQRSRSKTKSLHIAQQQLSSGTNGRIEILSSSNSQQKLKITINRLQSKQQVSNVRQASTSQLYATEHTSHVQSQSVLIQALSENQRQDMSVRSKQKQMQQHCISPHIMKQQSSQNSGSIDLRSNAFELSRAQGSGSSLSIVAKQLSHVRRSAQQMFPVGENNSDNQQKNIIDEFELLQDDFSEQQPKNKAQQIHQTQRSKSKKLVGDLTISQHPLISPRHNLNNESGSKKFKTRPKAYSQISRVGIEEKQSKANKTQTQHHSLIHSASVMVGGHQNAHPRTASKQAAAAQPSDTLHNILSRGLVAPAQATSADLHLRSMQKLMTFGQLTSPDGKHILQKHNYVTGRLDGSKRGSMSQMPKPGERAAQSAILQGLYKSHKSSAEIRPTAHKSTSAAKLQQSQLQNPQRKHQRLTKVAQEKQGDEELVEMENLQETALDGGGFEGNRIRSISHQYPTHMVFLRASQDKMQGITSLNNQANSNANTNEQQKSAK